MRKIETFTDAQLAKVAKHSLSSAGIECSLSNTEESSNYDLWVVDEDHLAEARKIIAEVIRSPQAALVKAQQLINQRPTVSVQERLQKIRAYRRKRGPIAYASDKPSMTIGLIGVCVFVFVILQISQLAIFTQYLYFSRYTYPLFVEIRDGQIWRLVTPIFLHFNILHIGFNMIWLYQLGTQIEFKQGPKFLLLLVVIIGVLSNTAEYLIAHQPFGGMSGVIYGLLGYIWTMGRFNPRSNYYMDNGTLWFMIIWLFLGMTNFLGPVANWCHLIGLVSGLAFGYFAAIRTSR